MRQVFRAEQARHLVRRRADLVGHARSYLKHPSQASQEISASMRQGSDLDRSLYVSFRKAVAPKTTIVRSWTARRSADSAPFEIARDRGFRVFEPGRFPEADEVVAFSQQLLERVNLDQSQARSKTKKTFMIPILDPSDLSRESPLLRFALCPDVLSAVAAYLGTVPILSSINVYLSQSASYKTWGKSQLFHCDGDDVSQIKIFVLASDVKMENGPLMVLDATTSQALRDEIGYQYRRRVSDEEAREAVGDPPLEPVMGRAGTVCFVDTSRCFHFGSRVEGDAQPRLAAVIQFTTPFSFMLPRKVRAGAPFRHLAREGDSSLAQLALGA
jgi:hypothetical protein